jgi:hypothetical protein
MDENINYFYRGKKGLRVFILTAIGLRGAAQAKASRGVYIVVNEQASRDCNKALQFKCEEYI